MIKNIYVAECYAFGCDAEFYINDIPIVIRGVDFSPSWAGPVNQYLVSGGNSMHVVIKPKRIPPEEYDLPEPEIKVARPKPEEKVVMKLSMYPQGARVGSDAGREIMEITWPTNSGLQAFPYKIGTKKIIRKGLSSKSWKKGRKLKLNNRTMFAVSAFLEEIHGIIENGDADKFIENSMRRIVDNSKAYGKSINENIKLIRNGFKQNLTSENWGLLPLDPEKYNLRLCAKRRMIYCVAKDMKAVIREQPDENNNTAYYDMFISKIRGKWRITL